MAMQESYTYEADNLFAGTQVQPVVADEALIAQVSGATDALARGTALGQLASGKFAIVDAERGEDGGTEIVAILAETVSAAALASGDVAAPVYFTGEFNQNAIVVGSGEATDYKDGARARGIFLKDTVA